MNIFLICLFAIVIVALLAVDLFNNKTSHKVSIREATIWSCIWIGTALLFSVVIGLFSNYTPALNGIAEISSWDKSLLFLTSYVIEKSLSVDNLFVFIMIFSFFKLKDEYHHKVLTYGILGAIVLRAVFIFCGMGIIQATKLSLFGITTEPYASINWLLVLFGFVLIWGAIKTCKGSSEDEEADFSKNLGVRIIKKLFPVVDFYDKDKLFTIQNGKRFATILLLVVAVIEVSDIMFATDSIPACLGVLASTKNLSYYDSSMLLYTSNIFAILGLRQLYFLLSAIKDKFKFLPYGIGVVLAFIGVKMIFAEFIHISSALSLIIVGSVLTLSILISMFHIEAENLIPELKEFEEDYKDPFME